MYKHYSDLYSKWCELYDKEKVEITTIEKYCTLYDKRILDIGCGTGRFTFRVLEKVKSAICVDNDSESIKVFREILHNKYSAYIQKTCEYCCNIEDLSVPDNSIDIAIFTWSFYALDAEQMILSINNIYSMLCEEGKLIILQPIGGEFEKVMRMFFTDHSDMDEYTLCLKRMEQFVLPLFKQVAKDLIVSEFIINDLNVFSEVLKMFAVTEGNCNAEETDHITSKNIKDLIEKYKINETYHFSDEVAMFIFEKRR